MRAQVAPELQPIYAGYYIWRGAPNEADLAPQTLREIFPYFCFYLPQRQQVITYPISGFNDDLRPGKRRYNFIWYRVADAAQMKEMCVDERGVQHEYSVPPPLIRKDLIAQMHSRRARHHAAGAARLRDEDPAAVHHADLRFHRAVDRVRPRRHGRRRGRQSARPHMGFGVAKAGGDAQALARALRDHDDIDTALKAYNAERQPIRQQRRDARPQARHPPRRQPQDRRRPPHARLVAERRGALDWIAVPNFLDAYK